MGRRIRNATPATRGGASGTSRRQRADYGVGASTQTTQTSGLMPVVSPPAGFTIVIRQPLKPWPASGGSGFEELIAGRVLVMIVCSDRVSSPRPPPAMACLPAGQNAPYDMFALFARSA